MSFGNSMGSGLGRGRGMMPRGYGNAGGPSGMQPGMSYPGGSATFDETGGLGASANIGLPGQSFPGFGNRYGPDQHQPGRGTPNTNPYGVGQGPLPGSPPPFPVEPSTPSSGSPWTPGPTWPGMITSVNSYGPDQHQPNRGTPNTTTQGPWTPGPTWPGMITSQPPMSDPFSVSAPNPTQMPQTGGIGYQAQPNPQQAPAQPQMIPGTNRPMPPGAFIDQYGIARRAPETPMNPGAKQFGQYTPGPNGFTLDQSGGMNRINGTLFSAEGLNQGGIAAPNYVDYLNRMFRR